MNIVDVIASQGRNGDTKLAHLTDGEIVIPKSAITDDVLEFLGDRVDRYTVGNKNNSKNPITGLPEFFDSNDDGVGTNEVENAGASTGGESVNGDNVGDPLGVLGSTNSNELANYARAYADENSFGAQVLSSLTPFSVKANEKTMGLDARVSLASVVGSVLGVPGLGLISEALGIDTNVNLGNISDVQGALGNIGAGAPGEYDNISFDNGGSEIQQITQEAKSTKMSDAISIDPFDTFIEDALKSIFQSSATVFADMPQFQLLNNDFGREVFNNSNFQSIVQTARQQ